MNETTEELKPVEDWEKHLKTPPWKAFLSRRLRGWVNGDLVSETEYKKAMSEASDYRVS